MSAALPKSNQQISLATHSATSSPASADGVSPSDLPGGPTTDLFGRVVAPASRSRRRGKAKELLTPATSGLSGSGSSASVALAQCLANKLQAQLGTAGSTLFRQTWKVKVTPSGRPYWAHTASAHRTSDNGFGSWPKPMLTSWATPQVADGRGATGPASKNKDLGRDVRMISHHGTTSSGSPAATAKPGQLNPAFSRWLMGYPPEWDACAATVTPLSRKSRPK